MIASSRTGVSSAVSRRACVPANPSFGLPSLSRNSRIVRRSPFSVAFKKDDGDTEEQRKDNFRKEVQDGLERIADHVENIDRTSGNAPSELDLDQQVSCINMSPMKGVVLLYVLAHACCCIPVSHTCIRCQQGITTRMAPVT